MEQAVFSQAFREYLRFRRVAPWLLLGIACAVLAFMWESLRPGSPPTERYATVSSMLVFRIVALASAIFTTAIVSQEVEQRTIVYLLTRPIARWKLLTIRYLASVLVVAILGIIAAILTSAGAYKGFGGNALLGNDLMAITIGAFAYGALFLFVSLIVNRAMIVCLLFAFGWETMVPNMPGTMDRLSILTYLQAIAQHPEAEQTDTVQKLASAAGGVNVITPDRAWATLIILVVVMLGLSAWWFTHFEYVPREDAE